MVAGTGAAGEAARPPEGGHSSTGSVEERYAARRDDAQRERDRLARRAGTTSNLRLAAFAVGIAALVWAELEPEAGAVALGLFALSVLAFIGLIIRHSRLTQAERRAAETAAVNAEAIARLRRDWDGLPEVAERGPAGHPYAHDLDIFGHGSLARLLSSTGTPIGRKRLQDWLLSPVEPATARQRQDAVRDLVPRLDFRQQIQVDGRLSGSPRLTDLERFLDWAEAEPWLLRRPVLLWPTRLIPLITLTLVVLHVEGVIDRAWWLAPLLVGVGLIVALGKRVGAVLDRASMGDASLRHYAGLVQRIQDQAFQSDRLRDAHMAVSDPVDARRELERLGWLTELADLRHGGLFYVLIHVPTLWDFHVLGALERWQRRAGRQVRQWIDRIAELDATAALASLPGDESGWSYPELATAGDRMIASGLAHPLLAENERVANDVEVGPPGTFLMVTGSNMSGKSTLLRSIGINAVLAQAGGPVCARELRLPPVDVRTSMRVEDSLERGVSLFMAELQQLKRVVDAADAARDRPILYLLDEILHGTNSAERQVAVREVLSHLLRRRAIGAISTHDLELGNTARLEGAVVPVHFRETVHPQGHEPPMSFDYQLRDGIATSTNALKLVRLVGLSDPGEGQAAPPPERGSAP